VVRARPEDGRIGDIWRVTGGLHEMVVEELSRFSISVNSVTQPQPSGWGYDLNDWDNVLYRFREDLSQVQIGDVVHLYVPATDVYLLMVTIDTRWPSLSNWFGFQVGRAPVPGLEGGLQFHPSADETFDCERLFRPFAMLPDGAHVRDTLGRQWRFTAPVGFSAEDGTRGEPAWPVELPGDEVATEALRATSPARELALWSKLSGVDPSAFDYRLPT
jgi:hypothetical protein